MPVRALLSFKIEQGLYRCPWCGEGQESLTYARVGEYKCDGCCRICKLECPACEEGTAHGVHQNCHHCL